MAVTASSNRAFFNQLRKYYTWYTGGFIVFLVVLAVLEQMGLPKVWIGYVFLFATIGLYAGIGITARAGILQWHGDGCGLDVRGVVHRHGRGAVPAGL